MEMDLRQAGLGVVIFILFYAMQAGYFNNLGTASWFVGLIVFEVILWLIGKGVMPKQSKEMTDLWIYVNIFALAVTFVASFGGLFMSGFAYPKPEVVLGFWFVLFGGAMLLTGQQSKWHVTTLTGLVWLFSAFFVTMFSGAMPYAYFGMLAALPFIIVGLMEKS